jgi:hypothetical protein
MSDNGSPIEFYHKNPRQITVQQFENLERWLEELGDLSGVVHDLNSNQIIGGNQRGRVFEINECEIVLTEENDEPDEQGTVAIGYIVWKGYRYTYRQVRWIEHQCEMANIVANRAGGEWDHDILANEFELNDLLKWGFIEHDLDLDLWLPEPPEDPGAQIDRAEELREKWGVETGQLWRLGEHRLICGDCIDAEVVARVMDGEKYDSMITDPPFFTPATHYQSRVKHQRKFSDLSALAGFWELVLKTTDEYRKNAAHVVVFCNCDSYAVFYPVMFSYFDKTKSLVWDKKHVGLGRIFRHQHELMVWGRNQEHYFEPNGTLYADVMPFEATPSKDREHPVEKPVELLAWIIAPLSPVGGIVLDPFGGAGPALIASEQLGRQCRYIDKDAAYCAVAIQRWVDMTGGEPELLSDPHGIEEPSQYKK